jgi:hypothetical protein
MRICAFVGVVSCFLLGIARADAPAPTGIVIVYGKGSARELATIETAISGTLRVAGWTFAEPPAAKDRDAIIVCDADKNPWACIEPYAGKYGIDSLLVAKVRSDKGEILITGRLVVPSKLLPVTEPKYCNSCSDPDLSLASAAMTQKLLERNAMRAPTDVAPDTTMLDVTTTPPGAALEIDGKSAGTTNREVVTTPGTHALKFHLSGYTDTSRSVDAVAHKKTSVDVTMQPEGAKQPPGARTVTTGIPRYVPVIVGVAGVAALVGGSIVSFTADDAPAGSSQGQYNYSLPGIGVAALGAVAIGVAVYVWVRHPPHTSITSAPAISLTNDGGVVGWSTRF